MNTATDSEAEGFPAPTSRPAAWGSIILPGVAMLMSSFIIYSAAVSFALRPKPDERVPAVGGAFFLGVVIGGLFFARVLEWSSGGVHRWRKAVIVLWLLSGLLTMVPGLHAYALNHQLRIVANLCLGMQFAPAYHLYFSRFPSNLRGMGFGFTNGAGLLIWNILIFLAMMNPPPADAPFHPYLMEVFVVNITSIAVLAAVCLYSFVAMPYAVQRSLVHATPYAGTAGSDSQARRIVLMLFAVYALSGVIQARLIPLIPATTSVLHTIPTALVILVAPIIGRVMDERLDIVIHRLIPIASWLMILSPSLVVLDPSHSLYGLMRSLVPFGQFSLFIIASVAVTRFAPTLEKAVWYTMCIFIARFVSVVSHLIWKALGVGNTATIVVSIFVAYVISKLAAKTSAAATVDDASQYSVEVSPGEKVAPADGATAGVSGIASFVDDARLTPREQEAARLLLAGRSLSDIAVVMGISARTVKKHAANIYQKYGVTNRHEFFRCYTDSLTDGHNDSALGKE